MSASVGAAFLVGAAISVAGAHLGADAHGIRRKRGAFSLVDDRPGDALADVAAVVILLVTVRTVHHAHYLWAWF